ncbi:magnesium transporter CorA family protein [Comamonas odontotermitis]|uniref:magnesium transporter CorA family protein n=1 Tax=Comamonas TaxID=283 RepID=UPI001CC63E92|nr:magnesium transporter CorA family protein [Comamonas odontotermitis]UBB17452.1 magnesium transporter CorA family protein [Comamonas odontotermitis]
MVSNPSSIRIFHIAGNEATELAAVPYQLPDKGFLWLACARSYFSEQLGSLQLALQKLSGAPLVDLHVSDLLNPQLPSHYDYTSQYDLLVIRRLASTPSKTGSAALAAARRTAAAKPTDDAPHISTTPVGFAAWERVLLSVHPEDCTVRDAYARRLLQFARTDASGSAPAEPDPLSNATQERLAREDKAYRAPAAAPAAGASGVQPVRLPTSPADLMMRTVNIIVDNYLDLRRELSRHLDQWQSALLAPRKRIANWQALLEARLTLHQLDEICEDQRAAVQDWVDAVETWPLPESASAQRELEALKVRSRDVLEHIERVVHHVRRLEQSTETAVQMHFSVQSNRANDIMRTLTTITAIFLPLNLIAAIFGMNFEFIPLIHKEDGFWWAMGVMALITVTLIGFFSYKRYLTRTGK